MSEPRRKRRLSGLNGLNPPPLGAVLPHGGHSEQSWRDARRIRRELEARGVKLPKLRNVVSGSERP